MRKVAVLTVGRSDFGRYLPVLRALRDSPGIFLRLLVTGNHFSERLGNTINEVSAAGFNWEAGLEMTLASDTPASVGKAIGLGTQSLAQAFAVDRPDLLVVLGDRYEMVCGPLAALGFGIPVIHIHGGALTEGAIDDAVRHSLTKLSHIHLVSCEEYARRVRQMGEEAWRVQVVGAPGLDDLASRATMTLAEVSAQAGVELGRPTALVCFHPVTLEPGRNKRHISEMLSALDEIAIQLLFTYPNADLGSDIIIAAIEKFAAFRPDRTHVIKNAGDRLYANLLKHAVVMVGNSSSGIVEAASFALPVVNIGSRQDGKVRAANVIDVEPEKSAILSAILRALSSEFREGLHGLVNPYGDGTAGKRIAAVIGSLEINDRLLRKRFVDL